MKPRKISLDKPKRFSYIVSMSLINLAENLKLLRQAQSLTQSQLAKNTGLSRQNVWDWENGKSLPTTDKLPIIADALNCTIDELVRPNRSLTAS
jgi:transcriptional regulator with XRE-family HTH domain